MHLSFHIGVITLLYQRSYIMQSKVHKNKLLIGKKIKLNV